MQSSPMWNLYKVILFFHTLSVVVKLGLRLNVGTSRHFWQQLDSPMRWGERQRMEIDWSFSLCSGVDFKVKTLTVDGNKTKLAIWVCGFIISFPFTSPKWPEDGAIAALMNTRRTSPSETCFLEVCADISVVSFPQDTAGQERFRTLTPSYYRGAQGVILGRKHCPGSVARSCFSQHGLLHCFTRCSEFFFPVMLCNFY